MNKSNEMKHDKTYQRNVKWYQAAGEMPEETLALAKLGTNVLGAYMLLVHCSNRVGACVISQKVLANSLHVSTRTARRCINKLVRCGAIAVMNINKRQKAYITNPYLLWQKTREERIGYANLLQFPVNIVSINNKVSITALSKDFDNARTHSSRTFNISDAVSEHVVNKKINFKTGEIKRKSHNNQLKKKRDQERKIQKYEDRIKAMHDSTAILKRKLKSEQLHLEH